MKAALAISRIGCVLILVCAGGWVLALPISVLEPGTGPLAAGASLQTEAEILRIEAFSLRRSGKKSEFDEKSGECIEKIEEAREIYQQVIEVNPANVVARDRLVKSYITANTLSDGKRAIVELLETLKTGRDRPETWLLAGSITAQLLKNREGTRADKRTADALLKRFFAGLHLPENDQLASRVKSAGKLLASVPANTKTDKQSLDMIQKVLIELVDVFCTKAAELKKRKGKSSAEIDIAIATFYLELKDQKFMDRVLFRPNEDQARLALLAARRAMEARPYSFDALALAGSACVYRFNTLGQGRREQEDQGQAEEDEEEDRKKLLDSAEEFYKRALRLKPKSPKVIKSLGGVFLKRVSIAAAKKAVKAIDYLLELKKDVEDEETERVIALATARLYAAGSNPDKATVLLTEMAGERKNSPEVGPDREQARLAVEAARRAVEERPNDLEALELAGNECMCLFDILQSESVEKEGHGEAQEVEEERKALLDSAEEYYKRALRLKPKSPGVVMSLERVLLEGVSIAAAKKAEQAVDYFQELKEPIEDEATRLVIALAAAKKADQAADHLRELKERKERIEDIRRIVMLATARLYGAGGNLDKAIALLTDIVGEHDDFLEEQVQLGSMLYRKALLTKGGNPDIVEKAKQHFLAAVRLSGRKSVNSVAPTLYPKDYRANMMRTFHTAMMALFHIFSSRGQYLKAADIIDQYKRVYYVLDQHGRLVHLKPVEIPAEGLTNAGIAYLRTGRRAEAITCFEETIRITSGWQDPYSDVGWKNFFAWEQLARIYLSSPDRGTSEEQRKKGLVLARKICYRMFHPKARAAEKRTSSAWKDPSARRGAEKHRHAWLARLFADVFRDQSKPVRMIEDKDRIRTLTNLLADEPDDVYAMLCLALIREALGDENARKDAQDALSMKHGDALRRSMDDRTKLSQVSEDWLDKLHEMAGALIERAQPEQ